MTKTLPFDWITADLVDEACKTVGLNIARWPSPFIRAVHVIVDVFPHTLDDVQKAHDALARHLRVPSDCLTVTAIPDRPYTELTFRVPDPGLM